MTSAVVLIDRSLGRLRDMLATGSVSELQRAINEIDAAGEIIVSTMEKRGCLRCPPCGKGV